MIRLLPATSVPCPPGRFGRVLLSLCLVLSAVLVAHASPAAAATDRLPDLRMAPLRDFRMVTQDGRRLLRFTAIMVNAGPGHFEVRGSRPSTAATHMAVSQLVFNSEGGSRLVPTNALAHYSGDGHDHWHVQQMMSYTLWPTSGATAFARGEKVGYCFFDTTPWNLSMAGARSSSYYREEWCGTRASLITRTGISVGWGDNYPWHFAFQWIDITGLPGGDYYVQSTVDADNLFLETNNGNNCTWNRIRIPASGSTVSLLSSGASCIAPPSHMAFPGVITYAQSRRIEMSAAEHVGYRFAANGAVISSLPVRLPRASGAPAVRSSTIPGQSGTWFLISDGIWEGYWMRESSAIVGGPMPAPFDAFPGTSPVPSASRINLAGGPHYGYQFTEAGATIQSRWYPLARDSGANVDRRGSLPTRSGTWSRISNGIWAGYWIRESDRAVFAAP